MVQSVNQADILIAGGSFAGLALALALSQQSGGDLRITVVSPDFPPIAPETINVRASALSRGSLHLLNHLGLWRDLQAVAEPVTSIELTDSGLDDALRPARLTYHLQPPGTAPQEPPNMVIIENHNLGRALHQAAKGAPGVTLHAGASLTAFSAGLDKVTAHLSTSEVVAASLLVAADGGRSHLRTQAGIRTIGRPYEQTGIIAIVEPQLPHNGRAIQHFLPAGPFALLPMTGNRVCVTWTEATARAREILALDALGFRAEIEKRFGHHLGALKIISDPRTWPLELTIAHTLIAPRFALVGDAAHSVHPIAGQGLNLGFRDVAALAESIIDAAGLGLDLGQALVLERYERWRRFDNLMCAAGFDAISRLFATNSTLARSARGAALGIADNLPGFKSWLIDEASGETGDRPRLLTSSQEIQSA